jgi:hypothetical protein
VLTEAGSAGGDGVKEFTLGIILKIQLRAADLAEAG